MRRAAASACIAVGWAFAAGCQDKVAPVPVPVPVPVVPVVPSAPDKTPVAIAPVVPTAAPAASTATADLSPLLIPVAGVRASELRNTFDEGRPGHKHEAIDIAAPRGREVLAAADGTLAKLFTSVPGGLTIYQFDTTKRFAYYYAHLDRYAEGLTEGMALRRGDVIGYVGTTGNAAPDAPHLHFAIFRLGPEKQWWKGEAIDPYPALR